MYAESERDSNRQSTTAWLAIECEDRSGILADVATTIAAFGGNINVRTRFDKVVAHMIGAV